MMVNPVLFMIPAMVAAAEQKVLAPLRDAGATAPDRAVPIADDDARGTHFVSLLRRGVIVEASPGRYYVDEGAIARAQRAGRGALPLLVLGLVALALLALLLLD
jgi:hypothetical protein